MEVEELDVVLPTETQALISDEDEAFLRSLIFEAGGAGSSDAGTEIVESGQLQQLSSYAGSSCDSAIASDDDRTSQLQLMSPCATTGSSSSNCDSADDDGSSSRLTEAASSFCGVCSRQLPNSHLYYGARVCSSCRAFFQRSVRTRQFEGFVCAGGGGGGARDAGFVGCRVDSRSRTSCKHCRFAGCLKSGMKAEDIDNKAKKKGKALAVKTEAILASMFTEEEEFYMNKLYNRMYDSSYGIYTDLFHRLPSFLSEFASVASGRSACFTVDSVKLMERADTDYMIKMMTSDDYGPASHLASSERMALVSANFHKLFGLMWCITDANYMMWTRKMVRVNTALLGFESVETSEEDDEGGGEEASSSSKREKNRAFIKQFYRSPWAPSISVEEEHRRLYDKVTTWTSGDPRPRVIVKSGLYVVVTPQLRNQASSDSIRDGVRNTLAMLILFFSPSSPELDPDLRAKADATQQQYIRTLHRYLVKKQGSARARHLLHEGLMILSYAEEISRLHSMMMNV